ncbi:hypothetical protein [Sphingobium sp. CAP-1]|uniref:hypothetical protein n=1 Tax=Sphingobium sp. CAP-1 TaxID=2676077 RepID=UPI0012BB43F5|nr:hypothetical protein [Sphingobium sp. CAP-1]QGP79991.1 hypothetical protein GL174_14115 [Sphingobium sp. CAP-1]
MSADRHAVAAYLATLSAIVLLALAGAAVCIWGSYDSEVNLARVLGALTFIGGAITGLIGVIGTFRPKSAVTIDQPPEKPVPMEDRP